MISNVMDAFQEYHEAKAKHDAAYAESVEAHTDWGYFGYHETSRLNIAASNLEAALGAFVDARVRAIMNEQRTAGV